MKNTVLFDILLFVLWILLFPIMVLWKLAKGAK